MVTGECIILLDIYIHVLVMVVDHSRLKLFRPSLWMTQDVLIHNLVSCFESFGGMPKFLLTDNMKTVMDEARTLRRKGKVNERFSRPLQKTLVSNCFHALLPHAIYAV